MNIDQTMPFLRDGSWPNVSKLTTSRTPSLPGAAGRSAKLISEIIAGKAPVEPKTALEFERVLGVDAGIWLGIEADYCLHPVKPADNNVRRDFL